MFVALSVESCRLHLAAGVETVMQNKQYLRCQDAAAYLQQRVGVGTPRTLANLRVTGGGPKYKKFGRIVVYAPCDLDAWLESKMTPCLQSTSHEMDLGHTKMSGLCSSNFDLSGV